MRVEIINTQWETAALTELHFRLCAEQVAESPLHELPHLLSLLKDKHLNSYALHIHPNIYGRFDVELNCVYPKIAHQQAKMNMQRKIGRLYRFFYGTPEQSHEQLTFIAFMEKLETYEPPNAFLTDELILSLPIHWCGLIETYQSLSQEGTRGDSYYHRLLNLQKPLILPPLNKSPCPFEPSDYFKTQLMTKFDAFMLTANYRPQGDCPFHMMIIPHEHKTDLMTLSRTELSEIEVILRTVITYRQPQSQRLRVYLQKHPQSGMTVPHMHIHILHTSSEKAYREDVIRQLRYLTSRLEGYVDQALTRAPLTSKEFQQLRWQHQSPLQRIFLQQSKIQHGLMNNTALVQMK